MSNHETTDWTGRTETESERLHRLVSEAHARYREVRAEAGHPYGGDPRTVLTDIAWADYEEALDAALAYDAAHPGDQFDAIRRGEFDALDAEEDRA